MTFKQKAGCCQREQTTGLRDGDRRTQRRGQKERAEGHREPSGSGVVDTVALTALLCTHLYAFVRTLAVQLKSMNFTV